jgi:hypothetical protein
VSKQVEQTAPEGVVASQEIALPDGQFLDLSDIGSVARAYDDLQRLKAMVREAEGRLKDALVEHSSELGHKTFTVEGVAKVEIKGGTERRYDAQGLKRAFKEAGMPEERIKEIVRETIEYKVAAVEANRAARANEKYAEIIEQHSTVEKKNPSVTVKRIGGSAATIPPARPAETEEMTASALSAPADDSGLAERDQKDEDAPQGVQARTDHPTGSIPASSDSRSASPDDEDMPF